MAATRSAARRRITTTSAPTTLQKVAAELLGTAFLVIIGGGTVTATDVLTRGHPIEADVGVIALAHAIALGVSIYAVGKISGGHINPAVTIGMLASGRIKPLLAAEYVAAQLVGGCLGAWGIIAVFGASAAQHTSLGVTSFSAPTSPIQAAVAEAIA
jgi:glycerol uptake facilitator protein